jgi:dolichyl-phosphate beta-glucosyltransferase
MVPLTVVIPVFDEAKRLEAGRSGLLRLREVLGHEVEGILVDDGSDDATLTLALTMAGKDLRVLARPHRGKGAAVRAGIDAAQGERILLTDIDWSVSPEEVARLLQVKADLVLAVREGRGASRLAEPWWRHAMGRLFNLWLQAVLISGYQDTQCGCKVITRTAAQAVVPRLRVDGWAFDVELLLVSRMLGFTVAEFPVTWRFEDDSKIRLVRDSLDMSREILSIRWNVLNGRYQ